MTDQEVLKTSTKGVLYRLSLASHLSGKIKGNQMHVSNDFNRVTQCQPTEWLKVFFTRVKCLVDIFYFS